MKSLFLVVAIVVVFATQNASAQIYIDNGSGNPIPVSEDKFASFRNKQTGTMHLVMQMRVPKLLILEIDGKLQMASYFGPTSYAVYGKQQRIMTTIKITGLNSFEIRSRDGRVLAEFDRVSEVQHKNFLTKKLNNSRQRPLDCPCLPSEEAAARVHANEVAQDSQKAQKQIDAEKVRLETFLAELILAAASKK
jgi:hypothetical protein